MSKSLPRTAAAIALTVLCAAGPAGAAEYAASIPYSPNHALVKQGYFDFAEAVKAATNGEIEFKVYAAEALLPAKGTLQGIADGVAQVGYHAGTYTPTALPVNNTVAGLSFAVPEIFVIAFASTDFGFNSPQAQAEWKSNGVVFGGGYSSVPYVLMCRHEVRTLADLSGKRLRTPGASWDRFAQSIGAVPVNVPSPEMHSGLDRGSLDCGINGGDALQTFGLWDVVKSVNLTPLGTYFAGFEWGYNKDFWTSLTTEQRRILLDQMAIAMVRTHIAYVEITETVLAEARNRGIAVIEPDATLTEAVANFAVSDVAAASAIAKDKLGLAEPDPAIADFLAAVAKWDKLLQGVDRKDEAALLQIVKTEIYDKIDANSYGLD